MSLLIWLPLNGNIKNQGLLGNFIFSSGTNASVNAAGKIGQCYNFSGTTGGEGVFSNPSAKLSDSLANHSFSIAAWIKIPSDNTNQFCPIVLIDYGISLLSGTTTRFQISSGESNSQNYFFNRVDYSTVAMNDGNWHHIVGTYDFTTKTSTLYIDGSYVNKKVYTGSGNYVQHLWKRGIDIGRNHNNNDATSFFRGMINDVRIYDHALSLMEIKELAKGLVCHYTLNDNCLQQTNKATKTTYSWPSTSSTAEYNTNDNSYEHVGSVVSITSTGSQRGIYLGHNAPLIQGKHYLCSCWINIHGNDSQTEFFLRKDTTTNAPYKLAFLSYNGETNCTLWPKDKWIYVSCIYTADNNYNLARLCTYVNGNGVKKAFFGWRIVELGEGEVSDCSGYLNNGAITGLLNISEDTPRYNNSIAITGGTSYITRDGIPSAKSVSLWVRFDNYPTNGTQFLFADPTSNLGIGTSVSSDVKYFIASTLSAITFLVGNLIKNDDWNHLVLTYDGTDRILYINGLKASVRSITSSWTVSKLTLGGRSTNLNYPFTGKLSDFRLYSTVLSQEDVTDLYNMGCLVSL